MNKQKKIKELTQQFTQVKNRINQLLSLREQIRGKIAILNEQVEEEKKKKKTKGGKKK